MLVGAAVAVAATWVASAPKVANSTSSVEGAVAGKGVLVAAGVGALLLAPVGGCAQRGGLEVVGTVVDDTVTVAVPALAANTQQSKMTQCQAEAGKKKLEGKERQAFVNECLKAKPAKADPSK